MVRKVSSIIVVALLIALSSFPVFAQPDLKLPWNFGDGYRLSGGLHVQGSLGVCAQVLISKMVALDFALPDGTEVLASAAGIVSKTGYEGLGGNYIILNHGDGWYTRYYHLSQILIKPGDKVLQGSLIGRSGNSGSGASRHHLHFEVHPGVNNVVIDGYSVQAVRVPGNSSVAFNYLGTLTKGARTSAIVYGQCGKGVKVSGASETVDAGGVGSAKSTNRKVASCTYSVGQDSSRQRLFQDAYNRNGGQNVLGCPSTPTYWWAGLIRQDFSNAAILHNEGADHPPFSVPAYVVKGGIWGFYRSNPIFGAPVSDEFTNSFGKPQTNFHNGFVWWDGVSARPVSYGEWFLIDRGGDPTANVTFLPDEGGGVRLIIDGQGGPGVWRSDAWVGKDIADIVITPGTRLYWEQFDRAHSLHFGVIVSGVDGAFRSLIYSANAYNWWVQPGWVALGPAENPNYRDPVYWKWESFSRNIFQDYLSEYGVAPSLARELRVGHFIYDAWASEAGGTVKNIAFDYLPPKTEIEIVPDFPDGGEGWYLSPPLITLTATDDASGVDRIEYNLGSVWQVYEKPFLIERNGEFTLRYRAVDRAGRFEGTKSVNLKVDTGYPQTQLLYSGPHYEDADGRNYVSLQTRFELEATDETSGVSETAYAYYGSSSETDLHFYTEPFILEGDEGRNTILYQSADNAGNVEEVKSQDFYLDSTAPVSVDDSDGQWHNEDVTVTITAQDSPAPDETPGSGVRKIIYGGSQAGEVSSDQVRIIFTAEGTHELTYYAIDNVENVEGERQANPIKIDKTPPEISGGPVESPNESGWYSRDVTVRFEAQDQPHLSGLRSVSPDTVVSTEGFNQKVSGTAEDHAGNTASITIFGINIDKTKPIARITFPEEGKYYNAKSWGQGGGRVIGTASDNLSGVAGVGIEIVGREIDNAQLGDYGKHWTGWEYLLVFAEDGSDDGRYTIFSRATDLAGNTESTDEVTFVFDSTPPSSTLDYTGSLGLHHNRLPISLTIEAKDNIGLDRVVFYYRSTTGGGEWRYRPPTKPVIGQLGRTIYNFQTLEEGGWEVVSSAVDRAGNREVYGEKTPVKFVYDSTPPITSVDLQGLMGWEGWYVSPVRLQLFADDAKPGIEVSGVSQVFYRINGSSLRVYEGGWTFEDGEYVLEFWSVDRAGNIEERNVRLFRVDTTPPTSKVTSLEEGAYYNGDSWPGISGAAGDNLSGIVGVEVRVDRGGEEGEWVRAEGTDGWSIGNFVPEDGFYTVYSRATDRAGNQEHTFRVSFVYDSIPPITSVDLRGLTGRGSWYVSPVKLSLSVLDANPFETYYVINGLGPQVYSGPLVLSDGVYELEFWSVDKAGNKEKSQFLIFGVDTIAPVAPAVSIAGGEFFRGDRIVVSLLAAAGEQIFYSLGGTDPALYLEPLVISDDTTLTVYAVDQAGNKSGTVSWDFVFNPAPVASTASQVLSEVLGASGGFSEPVGTTELPGVAGGGAVRGVADSGEEKTASPTVPILLFASGFLIYVAIRRLEGKSRMKKLKICNSRSLRTRSYQRRNLKPWGQVALFLVLLISLSFLPLFRPTPVSSSSSSPVVVNEVMYDPPAPLDDNFNEWVELRNVSADSVDLAGWTFCGKPLKSGYIEKNSGKIQADRGLIIPPGGYAVITDGGTGTEVYTNFEVVEDSIALHVGTASLCGGSLPNSSGKELVLAGGGFRESIIYQPSWGGNGNGRSVALFEGGWKEAHSTPGGENDLGSLPSNVLSSEPKEFPTPVINFSAPKATAAAAPFSVSIKLENFQPGTYYLKVRVGKDGQFYDGRTQGTNGKWLAWNASWLNFPQVVVGPSGSASKAVSALVDEDAPPGDYLIGVRVYDGDGFLDSAPTPIKVSAAVSADERPADSGETREAESVDPSTYTELSPAGEVLGEEAPPKGFKLNFYLIVGVLGLLIGGSGIFLAFRSPL